MLDYVRLRLTFKAATEVTLPQFAGATLQGLLRTSLHKAFCTEPGARCDACPEAGQCGFCSLTASRSGTGDSQVLPYVLDAPAVENPWLNRDHKFSFGLTLFGGAIGRLHRILAALTYWEGYDIGRAPLFVVQSMYERFGEPRKWPRELKPRGRIALDAVHMETGDGWRPVSFDGRYFSNPARRCLDPFAQNGLGPKRVRIKFASPLRAFKGKKPLLSATAFTPYAFFGFLGGRIKKLCNAWGRSFTREHPDYRQAKTAAEDLPPGDQSQLQAIRVKRFKHPFTTYRHYDGLLGEVTFERVPDILVSYIKTGEITHAGKFGAMGYGQYTATILD